MKVKDLASIICLVGTVGVAYMAYKELKKTKEETKKKEEEFKKAKDEFFEDNDDVDTIINSSDIAEFKELSLDQRTGAYEVMRFEAKSVNEATDIDTLKKRYKKFKEHTENMSKGSATRRETYIQLYTNAMNRIKEERLRRECQAREDARFKYEKEFRTALLSSFNTIVNSCGRYISANPSVCLNIKR